jgi:hypothetical protein
VFDYQQFADQYSRQRTLYIVTYEGNSKVPLTEEDQVVVYEGNRTVHIAEEDQTVYIIEQQGSNTVYIAA